MEVDSVYMSTRVINHDKSLPYKFNLVSLKLSSKLLFRKIDIDNSDNTVFFYIILLTICNNKSNRMATISILYLTMISIGHKNLLIFLRYVMTYTLLTFQLIITAINLYDI